MSVAWSKLLEVGPLADERAEVDFSIPLKEFPRLLPLLAASDGEAVGRVDFSREGRLAVAQVAVSAQVPLTCQRCLAPVICKVETVGRAALVATPAQAERVPEPLETMLAPEERISLRDLVEEELLLALPLVPRHEDHECVGDRAVAAAAPGSAAEPAAETHRPFGQLGELFKRQ
jgi:uncharacterized protein